MDYSDLFEKPDGIYALSHSVGPLCKQSRKALEQDYFAQWSINGGDAWPNWLSQIDAFSKSIGHVINANSESICPQENLASGFYSFITAIAKQVEHKHQNTIVMHKDAFASMGFVVQGLANTYKLNLVLLDSSPNDLDAWYDVFETHNVLACLVTHVHSNTSVVSKVQDICTIARQFEAYSMVDIAQSVGIVPVDVKAWQADAVFGSCVKWLCGGPGAGFMYVREALIESLEPDPIAWFSHENPFEFDIAHYTPAKNAKRFWGGTPSVAPYIVANASVSCLNEIGFETVMAHNHKLKRRLMNALKSNTHYQDYQDVEKFGGSLCLSAIDPSSTEFKLDKQKVRYDKRANVFRISLHIINTAEEAELIAECFA